MSSEDAAGTFEPHRALLRGLAYRMLGAIGEADDAVQDTFVRWLQTDRSEVRDPRAFLARAVTRLCLDRLKSARARREQYVGTWLPEPVVEPEGARADDLSVALLLSLERLSPLERAAFLLHDVFDQDYAAVAAALDRSEAAVRQLAARARAHVRADRPRFQATPESAARLGDAFHAAMIGGDLATLTRLLADDVVFYSDGGGKRAAALNPVCGHDRVLRLLVGLAAKRGLPDPTTVRRVLVNGLPGFVVRAPDGLETYALETDGAQVVAIYVVRNPEKLRHLGAGD